MASLRKVANGWRAEVYVHGIRKSGRFPGRAQARDWAQITEQELRAGQGDLAAVTHLTVADAFRRYEKEVSPAKKGARWESIRFRGLLRDKLAAVRLDRLSPADLADWRDRRLTEVSGATVARDMRLISHVFTIARREWGWLSANPLSDVRRPKSPKPRERRISPDEIKRIRIATGYREDAKPLAGFARTGAAFMFAIETAMRLGEICALTWPDIDGPACVAILRDTKNGWRREVPLSPAAMAIIAQLRDIRGDQKTVFGLTSEHAGAMFRKARNAAGIEGLTFHDTRHEAITRLAAKLDVLDLARMVGHRDIRMLQIYYNRSARDIARDL